ncbi:MAG TPA: hypothetical protein VMH80_06805 [Bryobacteraceae bacterium]|nr:hypothetical protein [Bryobacteraceae bacterium]
MPKNDEGEFELVLGNRQLISVFLIVVILLGVFFSMGYIVGRNSASAAPAETARNDKAPQPETAPTPDTSAQQPEPAASSQSDAQPAATTTQPETTAPPESKPAESKPARAEKAAQEPKPKPAPASPRAATPAPERASVTGQPPAGDYWQVVATARPDAEIIAETISKRGFHAVLAPAPKEGIFRVLVGPLPDAATQAKTRTSLEAAGFKNPILRKY